MTGCDDPSLSRARRPGHWLTLLSLSLILVLVGCGETGPSVNAPVPLESTTSQPPATPTTGRPAATTTSQQAAPTTSPGSPPMAIEVGGPDLGTPGGLGPPPAVPFGGVAVGTVSAPHVFELQNRSDHSVTVTRLLIGEGFHFTANDCTQVTLPPNRSGGCTYAVVFSPRRQGETKALITARMRHICTSNTYSPCDWDGQGLNPFYPHQQVDRDVTSSGRVVFFWQDWLVGLIGFGTAAGPTTS